MVLGRHPTRPAVWAYAIFLTLLLHVGIVLGARVLRPFSPSPVPPQEPEAIQVVFAPEADSYGKEPTFFSELPPDRADKAPDHPDFLSNVDSRAKDKTPGGGTEGLPTLNGESGAPEIRMEPGSPASPAPPPEPTAEAGSQAEEASPAQEKPQQGMQEPPPPEPSGEAPSSQERDSAAEAVPPRSVLFRDSPVETPDSLRDDRPAEAGSEVSDPTLPGNGADDLFQDEMSNPQGNALPYGDISLSTTAWDYAPWLQEFRRNLIRSWRAPFGYYLGVIHGWTFVQLEIARSGELLRMDVLGEEGHESLKNASLGVLRATAPYRPLPDKFPDKTLILQIKLIYPERKN
jgi:hypothetical protein